MLYALEFRLFMARKYGYFTFWFVWLLLVGGSVMPAGAQEKGETGQSPVTLKGTVQDENGLPFVGVNVLVKDTLLGMATDREGRFSLRVPRLPVTLVFSFIGYVRQEVKVSSGEPITVKLLPDVKSMEEVVVTGYGTFKKSAYAGSAARVGSEKLKDVPGVSFQDLLQGNASGVQFISNSGQPGSASSLRIRGMGSYNASNSPLYVIDGVPVQSGDVSSLGWEAGLDIMATLGTADIESITIIKDAAAASLYGSRAANGVVLITTKQGKEGRTDIELKADYGYSDFAMEFRPVMGGGERREYIYNALKAYALKNGSDEMEAMGYADDHIDDYAPVPWCGFVDWDDVLFQKGSYQSYEASLSGGSVALTYYMSLGYLNQEGVTSNSGFERISGRINVAYQATKRLKVGVNHLYSIVNQDVSLEDTYFVAPLSASRTAVTPSDPVYNKDGSWNCDFMGNGDCNPLAYLTYDYDRERVKRVFTTLFAEYEIVDRLKFKSTLNLDDMDVVGKSWSDPKASNGEADNGYLYETVDRHNKLVWSNQLTYKFDLWEDHHFDVLAAYEVDDQNLGYLSGDVANFATGEKNAISNGTKTLAVSGSEKRTRMVSYLSRLNYDYRNKYYFGASFRVDGSSRFHRDHRWGNFWSVSAAYRLIDEPFMAGVLGWLTDLKWRVSYGVNGTLPSDYYGYMGLSSLTSNYLDQPGYQLSQIENQNLKWETSYNLNVGLDFSLWNRLDVTLEYYQRITKNLLMDCPISLTTGFSDYLMNVGKIENKGVELEVGAVLFEEGDFTWRSTLNVSHNRNKVVKLSNGQSEIISNPLIYKEGKSYLTFYMIEFAGINADTGVPQFYTNEKDANGHYLKEITEDPSRANAIVLDKHGEPDVTGGWSNMLRYKWFDLSFLFSYQLGGYAFDSWSWLMENSGADLTINIPTYYRNSWKQPGDRTKYEQYIAYPDVAMNAYYSTRQLHSTDFIRLKTLTLGVTLPKAWCRKLGVQQVRFYTAAKNLWTWAAYDYYDPETVISGETHFNTPPLKSVTFGLHVNF